MSFRAHLAISLSILLLMIWASTGSLAPYAASLEGPKITDCGYLVNVDHEHFLGPFQMLGGAPRETWQESVYLRRILHPLMAYPLVNLLGFGAGGVLTNVVLQLLAFGWFGAVWMRRRFGDGASILTLWMLATYPGIAYWIGLPYAHAVIVPFSLVLFAALTWVADRTTPSRILPLSLLIGVLSTGYDLLPIYGFALFLLLLRPENLRRSWPWWIPSGILMLLPTVLVMLWLRTAHGVSPINDNTVIYVEFARSFVRQLNSWQWLNWLSYLFLFPKYLLENFVGFSHVGLSILFVVLLWLQRKRGLARTPFLPAETAVLVAATLLFLVSNLAPPYDGWELRGGLVPRLYQPAIVALVVWCARALSPVFFGVSASDFGPSRFARRTWWIVIALNASVAFGPILSLPHASYVHYLFYHHGQPLDLARNVAKHGKWPLGTCRPDFEPPPERRALW